MVSSGTEGLEASPKKLKELLGFEAAFGIPWDEQSFIARACEVGHPSLHDAGVPEELAEVVRKHCTWTHEQISAYRRDWCKKCKGPKIWKQKRSVC